jgi:hypothetical protein
MAGRAGRVIIRTLWIVYRGERDLASAGRGLLKIAAERRT